MPTRTPSTSGNWRADDADTWGLGAGVYPAATDHVEIDGGHTVTLGEDNTCASIRILSTLVGGGHTLTLQDGASQAVIFNHDGTIHAGSDLNVTITGTTSRQIDALDTNNINNLTIAPSSGTPTFSMITAMTLDGNLTITGGTLDTDSSSNHALTVTGGDISVSGTLLLNNSTVVVSDTDSALSIGNTGTVTCGDTNLTVNALSLGQGPFTAPSASGSFIITGEKSGLAFDYDGNQFIHNSGTIQIKTAASTFVDFTPNDAAHVDINNVTIDHASCVAKWTHACTIAGDLLIKQGTMEADDGDEAFTVQGNVTVGDGTGSANTAVLGNAADTAAMTFGSLTIASDGKYIATSGTTTVDQGSTYVLRNLGTFTPNNGTLKIARSSASGTRFLELGSGAIHKLVIDGSATNAATAFVGVVNCANDLEVTNGQFQAYGGSGDVTIDGNVTVSNSSILRTETSQLAAGGVNADFGSLTIASGATYKATPLTTTLTGGGANGDNSASLHGAGTFTHNNGTLHFASGAQYRIPVGGTFYNVTTDVNLYGYDGVLLPQPTMPDGTTANDFISILGTLRINNNAFNPYSIDGLYVHNLILGDGTGSANTAKISLAESDVFNGTVYVDNVTINSDGQFLFGDGDEPQSSTLNIYGSFRNLGGNVTIE